MPLDPILDWKQGLLADIRSMRARDFTPAQIIHELDKQYDQATKQTKRLLENLRISSPDFDERLLAVTISQNWQMFIDQQRNEVGNDLSLCITQGIEYEKSGDIDRAIILYEANIQDKFDGTLPYDRLRIIYTKRKQYADAIRVCQAYLALPDRPVGQDKPRFQHHLEKLQAKLATSVNNAAHG